MVAKIERRQGWAPFPDLFDWMDAVPGFRPGPGLHGIRVEEEFAEGEYRLHAELPGIDPDRDVEITVEGDTLTLRAERTERTEGKHRSEFRYGTFTRTVRFPTALRTEQTRATYADGVLTVTIPTAEEKAAAKTVKVERPS
jgi:HSP20 family molecular chaperone IbpA